MKAQATFLLLAVFLLCSCKNPPRENAIASAKTENETYYGPIIDMHIHAYSEGDPMLGMAHPPTLRNKTYKGARTATEQKQQTLERFRKHNFVKAMVTNGQSWKTEVQDLILVGLANTDIDSLRKKHAEGNVQVLAEMAPFYAGITADDPSLEPYFALAQELDIPVGFHVLPGGPNYGFHLMPQMLGGMRAYNANPLQLEGVLVKFPELRLYIMHGGWPYVEDIKALMYAHPNVYVDIAVINWILPQEEFHSYLKSLITSGFGSRILFGTDQMVWPETIDDAVAAVNSANFLTFEQKEDIFYDNAADFLGLTEEEIKAHKEN